MAPAMIWNAPATVDSFMGSPGISPAQELSAAVRSPKRRGSRRTLPPDAQPVPGETFVFTDFADAPQVFLTREQLIDELALMGFFVDSELPLRELNAPATGELRLTGPPVILEGGFRFNGV